MQQAEATWNAREVSQGVWKRPRALRMMRAHKKMLRRMWTIRSYMWLEHETIERHSHFSPLAWMRRLLHGPHHVERQRYHEQHVEDTHHEQAIVMNHASMRSKARDAMVDNASDE